MMEHEPTQQTIESPQGEARTEETRGMTLLDMTLRQAAEILKTISIHAEYPPHITALAESIAQRVLPETQTPATAPIIDS